MRPAIAVSLAVLSFAAAVPVRSARAEGPAAVTAATAKVRSAIPAPVEPEEGKPGLGFEWEGDFYEFFSISHNYSLKILDN